MVDDMRELVEELQPESILPPGKPLTNDRLLVENFAAKTRVYFEADRVPAWWTPARDRWLWETTMRSNILSSALFSTSARLASIPITISPKDVSNRTHRRLADWSSDLLRYYWDDIAQAVAFEWQVHDNGVFIEVMGGGRADGPIEPTRVPGTKDYLFGLGLQVLDGQYCQRTGDATYPVLYRYRPEGGGPEKYYKFHRSRIIYFAQMPSVRRDMKGVGYGATSRVIDQVLRLDDIRRLEDERMGARPISQIIFSRGIHAGEMEKTFEDADAKAEAASMGGDLRRSSRIVFLSAMGPADALRAASVEAIDLKRMPDGYDPEVYMNMAINLMSMGLGFDPREFWPATVRGATRADAEVQHWKSMRKTPGIWVKQISKQLDEKWCPSTASASFDQQDDEQDMQRAAIREVKARVIAAYITSGAIDVEAGWEMMLEEGDLNDDQVARLKVRFAEAEAKAEEAARQALAAASSAQPQGNGEEEGANVESD